MDKGINTFHLIQELAKVIHFVLFNGLASIKISDIT